MWWKVEGQKEQKSGIGIEKNDFGGKNVGFFRFLGAYGSVIRGRVIF